MGSSAIVAFKLANPCLTQQEIGDEFGISHQRVSYILRKHKIPSARNITVYKTTCPKCRGVKSSEALMCLKCSNAESDVPVLCSYCDTLFTRKQGHIIYHINKRHQTLFFCTNKCKGKYLGKRYGRNHPKNFLREETED